MGNIFLLFGLSMLDVFSLQFTGLQKLSTPRRGSTGVLSVFFMGGVSALIAGPCTTPVLGTLLGFVALRQNIAFGIAMLFVFSLGLGSAADTCGHILRSAFFPAEIRRLDGGN